MHLEGTKMYWDLWNTFWWRNLKWSIGFFVEKCMIYQQVKMKHQRPSILLSLLEMGTYSYGIFSWFFEISKGLQCHLGSCGQINKVSTFPSSKNETQHGNNLRFCMSRKLLARSTPMFTSNFRKNPRSYVNKAKL